MASSGLGGGGGQVGAVVGRLRRLLVPENSGEFLD
jgi:hypothetical protein